MVSYFFIFLRYKHCLYFPFGIVGIVIKKEEVKLIICYKFMALHFWNHSYSENVIFFFWAK